MSLLESSLSPPRKVATPGMDDHQLKPEDFETEGTLSKDAAKIIMKALCGARPVRFELLWPICSIARQVTKWTRACDKRLHRLICYIHNTPDHSLESFVGDDAQHCHPVLFSDADFAGDVVTAKSTSGCYQAIVGPNTFAPITASCKSRRVFRTAQRRAKSLLPSKVYELKAYKPSPSGSLSRSCLELSHNLRKRVRRSRLPSR